MLKLLFSFGSKYFIVSCSLTLSLILSSSSCTKSKKTETETDTDTDTEERKVRPYICPNGTPKPGENLARNVKGCAACYPGFTLSKGGFCEASFRHICLNGQVIEGISLGKAVQSCSSCDAGYSLESSSCKKSGSDINFGSLNGATHPDTGYLEHYFKIENYLGANKVIAQLPLPSASEGMSFESLKQTKNLAVMYRRISIRPLEFFPFSISPAGVISTNTDLDDTRTRACYMFRAKAVSADSNREVVYEITIDIKPIVVPEKHSWTYSLPGPLAGHAYAGSPNGSNGRWLTEIPSSCMGRFSQMKHEFIKGNNAFDYRATDPYDTRRTNRETIYRYLIGSPYYLPSFIKIYKDPYNEENRKAVYDNFTRAPYYFPGYAKTSLTGSGGAVNYEAMLKAIDGIYNAMLIPHALAIGEDYYRNPDPSVLAFPYYVGIDDVWYIFRNNDDAAQDAPLDWNKYNSGGNNIFQKTQSDSFTIRVTNSDSEAAERQDIRFTIKPDPRVIAHANTCEDKFPADSDPGVNKERARKRWACRYNSHFSPEPTISTTAAMRNELPSALSKDRGDYDLVAALEFDKFSELKKYLSVLDEDNFSTNPAGNLELRDGKLIIHQVRPVRLKNNRCDLSSPPNLISNNLFQFSHGYLEIRMKYQYLAEAWYGNVLMYNKHDPSGVPYSIISGLSKPCDSAPAGTCSGLSKPCGSSAYAYGKTCIQDEKERYVDRLDMEALGGFEIDLWERWAPGVRHSFVMHNTHGMGRSLKKRINLLYNVVGGTHRRVTIAYRGRYFDEYPSGYFTIGIEVAPKQNEKKVKITVFKNGNVYSTESSLNTRGASSLVLDRMQDIGGEDYKEWKRVNVQDDSCNSDAVYGYINYDHIRIFMPRNGYD